MTNVTQKKILIWKKTKPLQLSIRNDGRSAAENCKGILKISGREEKICWHVPTERYTTTINADSVEYLDECAILDGDPKEIFAKLNQFVGRFGDDKNGGRGSTTICEKHL